jgi:hypothetical protein
MALHSLDLTIGAAATQATSIITPCRHIHITNPTGNSAITFGGPEVGSGDATGVSVAAGASAEIGPFSADSPVGLNELYIDGTENDVVQITYVTH